METMLPETTCPCCGHRFAVGEDAFREEGTRTPFYRPLSAEVECPACEWVFVIDDDGVVLEDELDPGEGDAGGLFAIDDDGEWIVEELLRVTCPQCHNSHEVDGPGVTICPHCKHTLDVDGRGRVLNTKVLPLPECPRCGVPLEEKDWGGMFCGSCGRTFLPGREPEE
jgi:uncharacterized Zn finger protein (UPF0148 family)